MNAKGSNPADCLRVSYFWTSSRRFLDVVIVYCFSDVDRCLIDV
jgi:hypothetical protein